MLHLRLIVPRDRVGIVLDRLDTTPGVAHIVHDAGSAARPVGDVVLCDVVREAANDLVEWLQDQDVHHMGAIVMHDVEAVSDAAAAAERHAPGEPADALVWEELETRAREESALTISFLTFMAMAALIAAVGILNDSPILVIGAMVVGPEYGPLAALCVAIVRGRKAPARTAARTLGVGLALASAVALVSTVVFRVAGLAPEAYTLDEQQLTAFISRPDGTTVVVALAAGVVGMLSLTESRSGALVGVLVSVTTIPAAANIGVAAAYRSWNEVGGAALQLAINMMCLVVAGVGTLAIQSRYMRDTTRSDVTGGLS